MTEYLSNLLFLMPASIGIVLLIASFLLKKFPPRRINRFYGYSSPASRRSQVHWKFAQFIAARELSRISIIMIALGLLGLFAQTDPGLAAIIGGFIIAILIVYLIYNVELAIKKKFKDH